MFSSLVPVYASTLLLFDHPSRFYSPSIVSTQILRDLTSHRIVHQTLRAGVISRLPVELGSIFTWAWWQLEPELAHRSSHDVLGVTGASRCHQILLSSMNISIVLIVWKSYEKKFNQEIYIVIQISTLNKNLASLLFFPQNQSPQVVGIDFWPVLVWFFNFNFIFYLFIYFYWFQNILDVKDASLSSHPLLSNHHQPKNSATFHRLNIYIYKGGFSYPTLEENVHP